MPGSGKASSRRREEAQARAEQRARKAQVQRRVKWISAVTLAGLLVLGLAGWAIANGNGSEPEQAADGPSQEETLLAYFQCLRDNGLDVDDPDTGSGGPGMGTGQVDAGIDWEDPAVRAIVETCREETGGGPAQGGEFGENLAETDALFAFATCMQDHGIDMPDPDPDGTLNMPEDTDPESPEFQAAIGACQEHLDGGGVRIQGPGGGPRGAQR